MSGSLPFAAQEGNLERVVELLQEGSDVNEVSSSGACALYTACDKNYPEIVELLCSQDGIDLDLQKADGWCALLMAAHRGHSECLGHLVAAGCNVNITNANGATALYIAAQNGHTGVVRRLMEAGADPEVRKTTDGWTAVLIAAHKPHLETLDTLLAMGASPNSTNNNNATGLYVAAQNGAYDVAEILVRHNADLETAKTDGATPLYVSADKGHVDIVRMLLEAGAYPDATKVDGWNPLLTSSHRGHLEVARLLLESSANVNVRNGNGATPLYMCAQNGHAGLAEVLIDYGGDPNIAKSTDGWGPVLIASHKPHPEVLRVLLRRGANVDSVNQNGATACYIAAQKGYDHILAILLEHGADLDIAKTTDGWTPLQIACHKGHTNLVFTMAEHGCDFDKGNLNEATAVFIAAQQGYHPILKELLRAGADPDRCKNDGTRPCVAAARSNHPDCVETLLEYSREFDASVEAIRGHRANALTDAMLERIRFGRQEIQRERSLPQYDDMFGASPPPWRNGEPSAADPLGVNVDVSEVFVEAGVALADLVAPDAVAPLEALVPDDTPVTEVALPVLLEMAQLAHYAQQLVMHGVGVEQLQQLEDVMLAAMGMTASEVQRLRSVLGNGFSVSLEPHPQCWRPSACADPTADPSGVPTFTTTTTTTTATSSLSPSSGGAGLADTDADADAEAAEAADDCIQLHVDRDLHTTHRFLMFRHRDMCHPEHALKRMTPAYTSYQCDLCLTDHTGESYHCERCRFDACLDCAASTHWYLLSESHQHLMCGEPLPAHGPARTCAVCASTIEANKNVVWQCLACEHFECHSCFRPMARPQRPENVSVVRAGPHSAVVSWDPPTHTRGAPLADYRLFVGVERNGEGASPAVVFGGGRLLHHPDGIGDLSTIDSVQAAPPCRVRVTGLAADATYHFKVRAVSCSGEGLDTEVVGYSTTARYPPAPTCPVVVSAPDADRLAVAWQMPVNALNTLATVQGPGGVAARVNVTGFVVYLGHDDMVRVFRVGSNTCGAALPPLTPGVTYQVRVQACNALGTSPLSPPLVLTPPPAPLSGVTGEGLGEGEVRVGFALWDADDHGAPTRNAHVSGVEIMARIDLACLPEAMRDASDADGTRVVTARVAVDTAAAASAAGAASAAITGLLPGARYDVSVAAYVDDGAASWEGAEVVRVVVPPAVPRAPLALAQAGAAPWSLAVAWDPPLWDGGDPVYAYHVVCRDTGGAVLADFETADTREVAVSDGLAPGSWYTVEVHARNAIGESTDAAALRCCTLAEPVAEVEADADAWRVVWPAVYGDAVLGYHIDVYPDQGPDQDPAETAEPVASARVTVAEASAGAGQEADAGGAGTDGGASPLLSSPLPGSMLCGRPFRVTVRAETAAGLSSAEEGASGRLCTRPAAPERVWFESITEHAMRVCWSSSVACEARPVEGYRVRWTTLSEDEYAGDGVFVASTPGGTSHWDASDLTPGITYIVRVCVVSDGGEVGECSDEYWQPTLPGPPSDLVVDQCTADSVRLAWVPPPVDDGAVVQGYRLTVTADDGTETEHDVPCAGGAVFVLPETTVSGLEAGAMHAFALRAYTEHGEGVVGTTSHGTLARAPHDMSFSEITAHSMLLEWDASGCASSCPVREYRLRARRATSGFSMEQFGRGVRVARSRYAVHGLEAGTTYEFAVTCINEVGESIDVLRAFATSAQSVPDAPAWVAAVGSTHDTLTVAWHPPAHDGGSAVTAYVVSWRERNSPHNPHAQLRVSADDAAAAAAATPGTDAPFAAVLSGLRPGSAYRVVVRAENGLGMGAASSPEASWWTCAGAPLELVATLATTSSMTLIWLPPPTDARAPIVDYLVYHKRDRDEAWSEGVPLHSTTPTTVLDGLASGETYMVSVTALTRAGEGERSAPIWQRTRRGPPAAPRIRQTNTRALTQHPRGFDTIAIGWEPEGTGGTPLSMFRVVGWRGEVVRDTAPDIELSLDAGKRAVIVRDLAPMTAYCFAVSARNQVGDSELSIPFRVSTLAEHVWRRAGVQKDQLCDVCHSLAYNLFRNPFVCEQCGLAVHKGCRQNIVAGCRGVVGVVSGDEGDDEDSDFLLID